MILKIIPVLLDHDTDHCATETSRTNFKYCYSGPGADWGRDGGAVQQRWRGLSHGLGAALH